MMKLNSVYGCVLAICLSIAVARAQTGGVSMAPAATQVYELQSFSTNPLNSGTDILVPLRLAFSTIASLSGHPQVSLHIPPGNYTCPSILTTGSAVAPNNCSVLADGVTVTYPTSTLGSIPYANPIFVSGTDVQNFYWRGGSFIGYVFNQTLNPYTSNSWQPYEGVFTFNFGSSSTGCQNCIFEEVQGLNTGACVVYVNGTNSAPSSACTYQTTQIACNNIQIHHCNFNNCGGFLWDYGWLWQILSFTYYNVGGGYNSGGNYTANQYSMALNYMNASCLYGTVTFNTLTPSITYSGTLLTAGQQVSFYVGSGGTLPTGITPGQAYYILSAGLSATTLEVSTTPTGTPIQVTAAGATVQMLYNMSNAYSNMYLPTNEPSIADGAWYIGNTQNVAVTDTTWSAPGDTHKLEACQQSTLVGDTITSAVMGALFVTGCNTTTVTGCTVNGTDGSRVVSLEYESSNTILSGSTFFGGGRGSLFNAVSGLAITGCSFLNNNNKSLQSSGADYSKNRVDYNTATWALFSQFTIESTPSGPPQWTNIAFTGNIVSSNAPCNMWQIAASGSGLAVANNTFSGSNLYFWNSLAGDSVSNIHIGENAGCGGEISGQYSASLSTATSTWTIAHGLTNNIQSANSVIYKAYITPGNSFSAGTSSSPVTWYAYANGTDIIVTCSPALNSGTVLFNWRVEMTMN